MPEYKWHPIEDISEELYAFSDSDLRTLEEEWRVVREKTSAEVLDKILTEIKREWAIETGKIEGLYTLSRGITKTLIQYGISAKLIPQESTNIGPYHLTELLEDQQEVIEGLMDYVAQSKPLTNHYIWQMHQVFTRHQDTTEGITEDGMRVNIPLSKGEWKKLKNNPLQKDKTIHEYCPPEQVPNEMEHLLGLHQKHIAENVSPEVEAAFLHHRFTQIHPFQDGNGRVARALASLVFLREGNFPFVVKDEERMSYIDALEKADQGNLMPLVEFMVEKQKDLLYKAVHEAQSLDIDNDLFEIREQAKNYYNDVNRFEEKYKQADLQLLMWKDIAKDIITQYRNQIISTHFFNEDIAGKKVYLIHSKITDQNFKSFYPGILEVASQFQFNINFPHRDLQNIRLFLCVTGKENNPELLYAQVRHQKYEIGSFEYPIASDSRIGNLKFSRWLQNQLKTVFEQWAKDEGKRK